MTLSTRMWLSGALLPSLLLTVGLLVAGQAFRAALLSSLDQGLLAQAAAESVSLFDRPDGPHLHMAESPLLDAVRPFAPTGELYDAHGRLVAHFPPLPHPADEAPPEVAGLRAPVLDTRPTAHGRVRELVARVVAPSGEVFGLRLSASMAQLDASVWRYHQIALTLVALTTALLVALQRRFARRLSVRLGRLTAHLARVKDGALDAVPELDPERDELAQLREVLADATVQLRAARAAQDRLLADAAHELRTPLTLMRTSLDLALRRERAPDELRAALTDTRTEVDRLARLATSLLELGAAGRSWDLHQADLRAVLEEAAEAARAEAEARGVWLELEGPTEAPARFSPGALRQAVDNLVSNALRFAPKGTPIRLVLSSAPGGWQVVVRDEGPGIPVDQREAVFAPFHRIDQRGGSGLGLAIVAEVLRLHGGRASVRTPPSGRGNDIVLELPARPPAPTHTHG